MSHWKVDRRQTHDKLPGRYGGSPNLNLKLLNTYLVGVDAACIFHQINTHLISWTGGEFLPNSCPEVSC